MTKFCKFSVIRFQPDIERQETVNIGIVVFDDEGPRAVLAKNQGKLLALNPNYDLSIVFAHGKKIDATLKHIWNKTSSAEDCANIFSRGAVTITQPGVTETNSRTALEIAQDLLGHLVEPPTKRRKQTVRTTRLHTELKRFFRDAQILGNQPEDISQHLVVPNFPIDKEIGLFAEFALKNGKLHITETVDFRGTSHLAKSRESQAKSLLLIEAKNRMKNNDLQRYVVVTGANTNEQANMKLLARHAEEFIVRESNEDWQRYLDAIHQAANPAH